MRLSRRSFLQFSSALAMAGMLPGNLAAATSKRHLILGALVGGDETMCRVDLATARAQSVAIGFKGHAYIQNPKNADQFWTFEKWGPHAALVDFREGAVVARIDAGMARPFFGHGVYSHDGNIIYTSRYDYADTYGYVTGYDAATQKQVYEYRSTVGSPHDCRLLDENTLLIGGNGNKLKQNYPYPIFEAQLEPSALVRFDLQAGKVMHKAQVKDQYQLASHFRVMKDGAVLVVTKPSLSSAGSHGLIYFGHMDDNELQRIALPAAVQDMLQDEVLSLDVDETRHVAVITNPAGKMLIVVDTRNGKFLDVIGNPAKSVAFDPDSGTFYTANASLYAVNHELTKTEPLQVRIVGGDADGDMPSFVSSHSLLV